jgi:tetratricopeptide (TPR) repeat protein
VRSVAELEKIQEEQPDNTSITFELAAAYIKEGQPDKAREIVQETFDNVRKPFGFTMMGEQLLGNQQYEMAELILEEGFARFENDSGIQQLLMMAYMFNGKSAAEIEKYVAQLEEIRHNPTTLHIGNAYIAFIKDDPELALAIGEDALNKPNALYAPDILYLMGRVNSAIDQPDAALEHYSAALEYEVPSWLATHIEAEIVQLEQS